MVIARATDGDIGILPGHAPLIAGLDIWPLRVLTEESEIQIALCSGFIEVRPEKVTILAACALRVRVTALKSVDLPTFGSPTIPVLSIGANRIGLPAKGKIFFLWG